MILEEMYNGKLLVIGESIVHHRKLVPLYQACEAHMILQEMYDGTYKVVKNSWGEIGQIINKKDFTKLLLRWGNDEPLRAK